MKLISTGNSGYAMPLTAPSATAQQRNSATAQQRNSATAQQRNSATNFLTQQGMCLC